MFCRLRVVFFLFFVCNFLFARDIEQIPNLEACFFDGKSALRVNPMLTGVKGKDLNQESNISVLLFYRDGLPVKEEEILGYVEGRLISERPLTSYRVLDKIRKDKTVTVEDYAKHFEKYHKALEEFRIFQKKFDLKKKQQHRMALTRSDLKFYASDISGKYAESNDFFNKDGEFLLEPFPILENFVDQKSLQEKELEFLIQYETLKKIYNDAVDQYYKVMKEEKARYKDNFDPGDSTERFAVAFFGEQDYKIWSTEFCLDGEINYQSHDNVVWYLQYQVPIRKKDLFILDKLFSDNERVVYTVNGSNGFAKFDLSIFFLGAVKELLSLYLKGMLDMNFSTDLLQEGG